MTVVVMRPTRARCSSKTESLSTMASLRGCNLPPAEEMACQPRK